MSNKFSKIFIKFFPFLVIILVSLIPVYYTWGKLAIGGDTILPFNPEGVQKFLWQWYGSENGQYFSQNLAPLYLIYKVASYFALSLTAVSAIILFCFNFMAGLAIYKICKTLYKPESNIYLTFPAVFYIISPAVLNGWHYCFIYAFAPWFVYFIIKIIVARRITFFDILMSNVVIFFASVDLPNPKYLFFLYLFAFTMMVLALILKIINLRSILRNWWKIILFFLFSFYLLLPLVFFALNYSPENYGVHIKQNYSDAGLFMDQGSSTIEKMVQLHHSGENINAGDRNVYNASKKVVFAGSLFFICLLVNLFYDNENRQIAKTEIALLLLVCIYLFFAVGPNPPFGFIYMALVSGVGLLAFLRTTAGSVFFLSILYSILLFGFIQKFKGNNKLIITSLLTLTLLVSSYPLLDGKFYQNLDVVGNSTVDKKAYGVNLPAQYFETKKVIDEQKIDGKILHLKNNLAYINTDWGYFGPSVYNYLFDHYNIGFNSIFSRPENHSVAFLLDDKSLIVDKNKALIEMDNTSNIVDNKVLSVSAVSVNDYIPHFWVPTKSYKEDILIGDLSERSNQKETGEALYLTSQNIANSAVLGKIPEITDAKPAVEFKKINPTKYRIIFHQASATFPLVFNETFNTNWKIYQEKYTGADKQELAASAKDYVKYEGNDNFQATPTELDEYIGTGLISSLVSPSAQKQDEKAKGLEFVSKNLSGTIQNDNLSNGSFAETWFQKPILDDMRLVANGYSNSWLINPSKICDGSSSCKKNSDGSYNFEIVAEFFPQRVFWAGLGVSLASIIISVFLFRIKKNKDEKTTE